MNIGWVLERDHERYDGVRRINVYLMRVFYLLMATLLAMDVWSYILGHKGPWGNQEAMAWSVWAGFSTLAILGVFHPVKMIPLLLLEIFYKSLWLILVAYPLWQAGKLAGSTAEGETYVFLPVVLVILVIPWGYVFRTYIIDFKKRSQRLGTDHRPGLKSLGGVGMSNRLKMIGMTMLMLASSAIAEKLTEPKVINVDPGALRALIATADELKVTGGEYMHEKTLLVTSDPKAIQSFDDALLPQVPKSEYACLCGPTVTIYLYKGGKQLETIQYIAPDEVAVDSWNSYTHISKPFLLLNWFDEHGVDHPRQAYEEFYRLGNDPSGAAAAAILKSNFPKFDWQPKTAVNVDVDGDGVDDIAMMGYTEDTAAVGVVLGKKVDGKPVAKYLDFFRGGDSERAMSGRAATLGVYLTDEGVKEVTGDLPEGYKICDDCFEIEVESDGDAESDPIWVYWDHVSEGLNWWRA